MGSCLCGCGEEVKHSYKKGHGRRGKKNSKEHSEKISAANKGRKTGRPAWNRGRAGVYHHSDEVKEKISAISKSKGFGKWMKGKRMSDKAKQLVSLKLVGHVVSQNTRKLIGKANSGSNNGMHGKTHTVSVRQKISEHAKEMWKNPIIRKKLVDFANSPRGVQLNREKALKTALVMSQRGHRRFFNTKPELQMKAILDKLEIKYIRNYPIRDIPHKYCCDFFIPQNRIVIEVDGLYWHNFPVGRPIDKVREIEMKNAGYTIYRFWEDHFTEDSVKDSFNISWSA